jgi:hypothetical protein
MSKNSKILVGVVLLVIGAVVLYMIMNKKGTTSTTTTTSTGLHGLDLGSIFSSLSSTGTKPAETDPDEDRDLARPREGARSNMDLANSL